MKLIGRADRGFIVEMTYTDMANFLGEHYSSSEPAKLRIGDTIDVPMMYQKLHDLSSNENKLQDCAEHLRKVADSIEQISPIIKANTGQHE